MSRKVIETIDLSHDDEDMPAGKKQRASNSSNVMKQNRSSTKQEDIDTLGVTIYCEKVLTSIETH